MAKHKAAGGKASQHVSPEGKRLGIKMASGQKVLPGMVLVRQRGREFKPGDGVEIGRDFTLYSQISGTVKFEKKLGKKVVSISPN